MPRRKSRRKLFDMSTCPNPACGHMTGMVSAGKDLFGNDRYNCHQCGKNFDENAREIPEDEMKIIREKMRKEEEEYEKRKMGPKET